jgi:hypothetical protein
MTALEMKVEILEIVANTKDQNTVTRIFEKVHEALEEENEENENDWWDDLTPSQQLRLQTSIDESYDPKNWISHEDVMKKYEKWFKK